jgi:hypothetical protein
MIIGLIITAKKFQQELFLAILNMDRSLNLLEMIIDFYPIPKYNVDKS